ncbi:hypothetical protein R1flu_022210 [Riccia fluitans]|uniref:RBR-type E3 ubiquitin transferase n=1 Tax=Riccia fluitans TaxID=41844 RepID=A0ABD1ZSG8_9MARC
MTDVVAVQEQLREICEAIALQSDLEMAYSMQMEEALATSARTANSSKDKMIMSYDVDADIEFLSPVDGFSSVLYFQRDELLKLEQGIRDQQQALEDAHGSLLEIQRSYHDMEFARAVAEMSDREWESRGICFEKPFDGIEKGLECKAAYTLYTARVSESPGHVAIAWSLMDAEERVLIEQSRYLGLKVSVYVADCTALREGLSVAVSSGVKRIHVCCNSLAVVEQIAGQLKSHAPKQAKLLEQILERKGQFEVFSAERVESHRNLHARNLAQEALRKRSDLRLKKAEEDASSSEWRDDEEGGTHDDEAGTSASQRQEEEEQEQDASASEQHHGEEEDVSASHRKASSSGEMDKMGDCPICLESILPVDTFRVNGCSHWFCKNCLNKHVDIRVKSNQVPVKCPQECSNILDIDECQNILSPELLEAYAKGLTEASIPESERVFCPFPNCSSFMSRLPTSAAPSSSTTGVVESTECMECHRLFCAECLVPWHADISCDEYQKFPPDARNPEDIKFQRLAKLKRWQRCKKCRHMIEHVQGCYHITCRCGYQFCYVCGEPWASGHQSSRCRFWDEENL